MPIRTTILMRACQAVPLLVLLQLAVAVEAQPARDDDFGIARPAYQSISSPAIPERLCSGSEKNSALRTFAVEDARAVGNILIADQQVMDLSNAITRFHQQGRSIPPALRRWQVTAQTEAAQHRRNAEEAHARYRRLAAMPLSDCMLARPETTERSVRLLESAIDEAAVARATSPAQRGQVTNGIIGRLKTHDRESADMRRIATALALLLDRDALQRRSMLTTVIASLETGSPATRRRSLQALSAEVLDRATHFTQMMAVGEYDSEDAARLLNIAKYAAQLRDDLRAPGGAVSGDNQSKATRNLATAYAVAALLHGARDGDGRLIVDGVRDLIGPTPLASSIGPIVDIPAEVVAAITTVSRKGTIKSAEALEDVAAAMQDDPRAVARAIAHARELEGILSGASYGNAMREAITSRLIDRVPALRTVMNWWPDDPQGATTARIAAVPAKVVNFEWHWSGRHPSLNERDVFQCGPSPFRSTDGVYGTDEYSDRSALCVAAVHAGAIDWTGGRFRIRYIEPDGSPLLSSLRHGIESEGGGLLKHTRRFSVEPVR